MNDYGELDLMIENRTRYAIKGKREDIATVNTGDIYTRVSARDIYPELKKCF